MSDEKARLKFITVPFKADSPNGMMSYRGIAKFSFAGIVIEYESKILDMVGGEVKEIQIRLTNYQKISQLPNKDGKIKLNIKRENYELAQAAVQQMLRYIKSDDHASLESADESDKYLPPVRTSVNELFDTEKLKK